MATRKVKRYNGDEDSDVRSFAGTPENESNAGMKEAADADRSFMTEKEPGWESKTSTAATPTFKEAFAAARRAGDKTFSWGGKKFTTELAGAKKSTDTGDETARLLARKPALKYQSLQDRKRSYEAERAKSGVGMYGTTKRERSPLPTASDMAYKKGGMTASKRADGIAQRGKTKGTIVACGGGYMKGKK